MCLVWQYEHTNLDNLEEDVHNLRQRPSGESCCGEASHLWHEEDRFLSLRFDDIAWYGVVPATRVALQSLVDYGLLISWFDNLDNPDRRFHDVSTPNSTLGRKASGISSTRSTICGISQKAHIRAEDSPQE